MLPFIQKVQDAIVRHSMIGADDRVLVGVSGGADSTALVLALNDLGYALAIAHVNHNLRGSEADADEDFVKAFAERLGLPYYSLKVNVREAGGNLEAAGRRARKEFFRLLQQEHGFTRIALAHNRDDRIETFLIHLLRGAGSQGLTSMSPTAGHVIRPFLEIPRFEIEAYLRSVEQPWRTDSTNLDMSLTRNRIRHEVIPLLSSLFNDRLSDTLSRTLTILHDEDDWMKQVAHSWLESHGNEEGIDVEALRREPTGFARRLIREALREESAALTDITFEQVESIRNLLTPGKSGKWIPLPGGVRATREFNKLLFQSSAVIEPAFEYELQIPGWVRVPELNQVIRATFTEDQPALEPTESRVLIDGDRLGPYVRIRNWKPGDYYRPLGWSAGKVKKLFQKARVPRSQRYRKPIVVSGSTIIWVASFPVSRDYVPGVHSKKIVAFETLEG